MINQSNLPPTNNGINAVSKIVPVISIDKIGQSGQEHASKITQLVLGRIYIAEVLTKVSDTAYQVKVDGMLLKMELGNAAHTGQTLQLRYIENKPVPTFFLASNLVQLTETEADISSGAKLLGTLLQEAKVEGATPRFQAHAVVSQHPNNPQVLAQDLKQAVTQTGLFYESHLSEFAQGQRSLTSVLQESQNLQNAPIATLVSQQLQVLETNKFSWNGEVWPGQNMLLDVFEVKKNIVHEDASHQGETFQEEQRPMQSEMTLHLPNLGKVQAKLRLVDGRLSIQLAAESHETSVMLNQQKQTLAHAFEQNGQILEGLTVSSLLKAKASAAKAADSKKAEIRSVSLI
jgi:hypothetical protein